jgi:alkanesulfonate monooxygenase SsuD/methylene tetrahydromethanopterin reductase-like flavin-dependent oxidoreductase (luciferase family)
MDHLIQIGGVGAPDEPFMEGWTVLSALAAVTSRIRLATLASSVAYATLIICRRSPPAST